VRRGRRIGNSNPGIHMGEKEKSNVGKKKGKSTRYAGTDLNLHPPRTDRSEQLAQETREGVGGRGRVSTLGDRVGPSGAEKKGMKSHKGKKTSRPQKQGGGM